MSIPDSPHPPTGHPADASEWAEYLRRYDRYLDLYERHLEQNAEYNRQVGEAARVQSQGNELYGRWVRWQRQGMLWVFAIMVLVLAVAGVASLFR
jgi:hypothetical protein